MAPIAITSPAIVEPAAAGSCTGWKSTTSPPKTIRVYRSAKGKVEVVDFRRYVEVVTAIEWPSYIPKAAIEVGAVAVKQWAWKRVLAGAHRRGYYTSGGNCFDVLDTSRDQLYKPERASVTRRIKSAVSNTWGITLWKRGNFISTGYRAGSSRRCGADANGSLLYAKSVIDCARRGKTRTQIQFIYYGPRLRIRLADGTRVSPEVSQPKPTPKPSPPPPPKPEPKPQPQPNPEPEVELTQKQALWLAFFESSDEMPATASLEWLSPYGTDPATWPNWGPWLVASDSESTAESDTDPDSESEPESGSRSGPAEFG